MAVKVPLQSSDLFALVDEADADAVLARSWRLHSSGRYACSSEVIAGRKRWVLMHRFIIGAATGGSEIDHLNGNGLDNRRSNLRAATRSENCHNRRKWSSGRFPYKGITGGPGPRHRGYTAAICVEGRRHHLGTFPTIEEAASAYDIAAVLRIGAFARLNFPHVFPEVSYREERGFG